jgi:hypothetical protein
VLKRAKLKEMKALQSEIKSRRQAERDAKRQAREDKEKRRKENELKSASVQVVRAVSWLGCVAIWTARRTQRLFIVMFFYDADFAHAPHEDDEQEATTQHQEDDCEQARRRRVRARVLQVSAFDSFANATTSNNCSTVWKTIEFPSRDRSQKRQQNSSIFAAYFAWEHARGCSLWLLVVAAFFSYQNLCISNIETYFWFLPHCC